MKNENLDKIPDRVRIQHPRDLMGGPSQVWATVGRDEIQAFFYYADRISFTMEELKGLTVNEMRDLRHLKDAAASEMEPCTTN
jgi:hypothetical protein